MKHVCELAIIGLLLKPVKTRVVPHKVGLISEREGFVCRVMLHTYYKHAREGLLEIQVVRFKDFFPIPGMVCFNKCLLKATAFGRYRCSLTVVLGFLFQDIDSAPSSLPVVFIVVM